jgi:pyrimidine operon attenuation protein/uracil phosphoribosyltransferase
MNDLPIGSRTCLYDADHMNAVMDSMARQASVLLHGCTRLAIIGILRRGAPLADKLTDLLVNEYALPKPLRLNLSVKRYADDLTLLYPETQLKEDQQIENLDLAGFTLLIVDDVLYTGHSLFKVVEYLIKKHPSQIRVACLADRKVNTIPIKADIVGVSLQIAPQDVVECHVPPYEPTFQIDLLQLT